MPSENYALKKRVKTNLNNSKTTKKQLKVE